ncbi:unnamed protein product, partial [Didymodactylos carnosus]
DDNTENLPQKEKSKLPSSSSSSQQVKITVKKNDDQEESHMVYIPVLPHSVSNLELEKTISTRLQDFQIRVKQCQCISEIGVVSYIVFDTTKHDQDEDLPTLDEISQYWPQLLKSERPPQCEIVSVDFPNIIKVISYSIDDLLLAANFGIFSIKDLQGKIYARVDCSFLENLPIKSVPSQFQKIDLLLYSFIVKQLDMSPQDVQTHGQQCQKEAEHLYKLLISEKSNKTTTDTQIYVLPKEITEFKMLFHIELNKESRNVIILASTTVQKWLNRDFIYFYGRLLQKPNHLGYNVTVKLPIIPTTTTDSVQQSLESHPMFQNFVKQMQITDEMAIIEFSDRSVYDKCIKSGSIQIKINNKNQTLQVERYSSTNNPSEMDINVQNWYGTKMKDCKADITQFVPTDSIFRYKRNSKIWLDEFLKVKNDNDIKQSNSTKRLLRVTVMLNTISAIRNKK